jgi:phage repressor protein C with HTH and peptisase S24 domain
MSSPGERLRQLQAAAGFATLADFARAAGIPVGTARQHLNRDSVPKEAAQRYVGRARATGATVEWLLFGSGAAPRGVPANELAAGGLLPQSAVMGGGGGSGRNTGSGVGRSARADSAAPSTESGDPANGGLPERHDMPKDVPVYGTVQGGDLAENADFELNGEIIDLVRRPPRLIGRADIFALYVRGLSMSPWREPGGLVYVESNREPKVLDYVVIELHPKRGDTARPALIKRLAGRKGSKLRLLQYSPAREFEIEQRQILKIYRVLDWEELMGV